MLRTPYPFASGEGDSNEMTEYDAWSALLFDRVAHLTDMNDDELGRELARRTGRRRPFSRSTVASWRAGSGAPPLPVALAAMELTGYDVPFLGKLAPTREYAESKRPELPKAVGGHEVRLRLAYGGLAVLTVLAGLSLAISTRSSNPQVWVKAAQQVIHSSVEGVSPSTTTAEASGSAQGSQASRPVHNVAYVDEDAQPSPTPSSKPTGVGPKPASNSASASASVSTRPTDPTVAANYDAYSAELRARLRAAARVAVATPAPPPAATPTPDPTPTPTAPPPPPPSVTVTATTTASAP